MISREPGDYPKFVQIIFLIFHIPIKMIKALFNFLSKK